MPDQVSVPGPFEDLRAEVEKARLEMERARLALDTAHRQDEAVLTFLERWRTSVQPVHEHRLMSREQGHGYAKAATQMLFLLNGGALVAFPAFAQLVGNGFRTHLDWAQASIGAFILGLVLDAIVALLAYISMASDATAIEHKEEHVKFELYQALSNDNAAKATYGAKCADEEALRAKYFRYATRLAVWGLVFWVGSLLAFIGGALCAAHVLSSG